MSCSSFRRVGFGFNISSSGKDLSHFASKSSGSCHKPRLHGQFRDGLVISTTHPLDDDVLVHGERDRMFCSTVDAVLMLHRHPVRGSESILI